jgi:hypothetical protein
VSAFSPADAILSGSIISAVRSMTLLSLPRSGACASLGESDEVTSAHAKAPWMTRVASTSFWSLMRFIDVRIASAKSMFIVLGP